MARDVLPTDLDDVDIVIRARTNAPVADYNNLVGNHVWRLSVVENKTELFV